MGNSNVTLVPTESPGTGTVCHNNLSSIPASYVMISYTLFPLPPCLWKFLAQRSHKELLIHLLHVVHREIQTRLQEISSGFEDDLQWYNCYKETYAPLCSDSVPGFTLQTTNPIFFSWISLVCPRRWYFYQRRCFLLSPFELSWNKSKDFCKTEGSTLTIVDTPEKLVRILGWYSKWLTLQLPREVEMRGQFGWCNMGWEEERKGEVAGWDPKPLALNLEVRDSSQ